MTSANADPRRQATEPKLDAPSRIRVLVADDHPIVRQGIRQVLEKSADVEIVAEVGDGPAVLESVRDQAPDVVIMDISMPGMGGLDVLHRLKKEHARLPVIILSMHSEEQYAARVLKLGASGYLTKDSAPKELDSAVRRVWEGGVYVSPKFAETLAAELGSNEDKPAHEKLSNREYDVMLMVASGKSVGQIAEELCLSAKTVSTYRTRVLQKLDLSSTGELIRYALQRGLVD